MHVRRIMFRRLFNGLCLYFGAAVPGVVHLRGSLQEPTTSGELTNNSIAAHSMVPALTEYCIIRTTEASGHLPYHTTGRLSTWLAGYKAGLALSLSQTTYSHLMQTLIQRRRSFSEDFLAATLPPHVSNARRYSSWLALSEQFSRSLLLADNFDSRRFPDQCW